MLPFSIFSDLKCAENHCLVKKHCGCYLESVHQWQYRLWLAHPVLSQHRVRLYSRMPPG